MSEVLVIKLLIAILVMGVFMYFLLHYNGGKEQISFRQKLRTSLAGFIANFLDTFGIGSFATIFALRSVFQLMPDYKRYTGSLVIQATLVTMFQSLIFLQLVKLDVLTLLVSCALLAGGGAVSGYLVRFISRRLVNRVMLLTFIVTAIIVFLNYFQLLHIAGDLIAVRGVKLFVLGLVMFLAGCLPAFGVGYYSIVLVVIFLLGLSPAVAYPIMTTASALQMPMTAIPMIRSRSYYSLSALLMAIPGCIAVFISAPIISRVDSSYLKIVLLVVLGYNIWMLFKARRALAV